MSKNGSHGKIHVAGDGAAWDEELRLWLENHIKENPHLTPLVLSRREYIGMSRTAVDAYLKCEYFDKGDGAGVKSSRLEGLIKAYRERIEGTSRHGITNTF